MKTNMTKPTKNHHSASAAPPKRTFEAELATLDALRDLSAAVAAPEVAKALRRPGGLPVLVHIVSWRA
jgi:hypothetical protein